MLQLSPKEFLTQKKTFPESHSLLSRYRVSATNRVEQTNSGVDYKRHREPSPKRFSHFFGRVSSVDNEVQRIGATPNMKKAIRTLTPNERNQCKKLATKLKTIIQITIGLSPEFQPNRYRPSE